MRSYGRTRSLFFSYNISPVDLFYCHKLHFIVTYGNGF